MRTELEDWKNGWFGVQLALNDDKIDIVIERLMMLKADPDQHFRVSSTYADAGGLGDITVCRQSESKASNMESIGSSAYAPGDDVPL